MIKKKTKFLRYFNRNSSTGSCKKFYDRVRGYDDVTKMQYLDINLWMVGDILLKADRMSMANSLELRVPSFERKDFDVAEKLPTNLRVNRKNTKYAMRMAALRHLPKETAQKEKLGFPVPTRVWLRDEKFYNIVKDMFKSETAEMFFNTDVLVNFLTNISTTKRITAVRSGQSMYSCFGIISISVLTM